MPRTAVCASEQRAAEPGSAPSSASRIAHRVASARGRQAVAALGAAPEPAPSSSGAVAAAAFGSGVRPLVVGAVSFFEAMFISSVYGWRE